METTSPGAQPEAPATPPAAPNATATPPKPPVTSMSAPTGKTPKLEAIITLNIPIRRQEGELKTLTMRRPKVRDRLAAEDDTSLRTDLMKEVRMIGNLTGLTPTEIDDMDAADLQQCQDTLRGFIFPQLGS
jgi:hypothetical protein